MSNTCFVIHRTELAEVAVNIVYKAEELPF